MKNIKPIGNRVLVELIKAANATESGFILSSEDRIEQARGKVIAVGAGFGDEKEALSQIKAGDIVYFSRYGGEDLTDARGDITHKIIDIGSVLAVEAQKK